MSAPVLNPKPAEAAAALPPLTDAQCARVAALLSAVRS